MGRAEGRGKEGRERSRLIYRQQHRYSGRKRQRERERQVGKRGISTELCTDKKLCFISFTVLRRERLPVLVVKS
jgi:hypothetical protein